MRVIPVLDILGGQVVRAVAGRREQYRPVISRWTRSSRPSDVAKALQDAYGFTEFYVADLDGILRGQPNCTSLEQLLKVGLNLWVDAGYRDFHGLHEFLTGLTCWPVVGLESFRLCDGESAAVEEMMRGLATTPSLLSLDSRAGQLQIAEPGWHSWSVAKVVAWWASRGWRRFLVLDLAAVGTGELHWNLRLLNEARPAAPEAEWYVGGGVRSANDLEELVQLGLEAVLVGSALHDGRLSPSQLRYFVQK